MSEQKDKLIEKLKQAVKDTRDCKDIDLPEELYEVFCSIQNQAIGDARRESRGQALIEAGELCRSYIEEAKKRGEKRVVDYLKEHLVPLGACDARVISRDEYVLLDEDWKVVAKMGQALKEGK